MTTTPHTRCGDIPAFRTKDGSEVRELMHPRSHDCRQQSLAQATVDPHARTALHRHHRSEELYHIVAGVGLMTLGEREFEVAAGDTVCIAPGTPHRIANIGPDPLRLLCCCSPAYLDDDTELLEGTGPQASLR